MSDWKQLKGNGRGATVSFENTAGERVTVARPGNATAAVRECVDAVRAIDPSMLVVAISTPQTIYSDLRGRDLDDRGVYDVLPEMAMLRTAKRFDACHPRLMGRTDQAERDRRIGGRKFRA